VFLICRRPAGAFLAANFYAQAAAGGALSAGFDLSDIWRRQKIMKRVSQLEPDGSSSLSPWCAHSRISSVPSNPFLTVVILVEYADRLRPGAHRSGDN
jgi:hypothetical protein